VPRTVQVRSEHRDEPAPEPREPPDRPSEPPPTLARPTTRRRCRRSRRATGSVAFRRSSSSGAARGRSAPAERWRRSRSPGASSSRGGAPWVARGCGHTACLIRSARAPVRPARARRARDLGMLQRGATCRLRCRARLRRRAGSLLSVDGPRPSRGHGVRSTPRCARSPVRIGRLLFPGAARRLPFPLRRDVGARCRIGQSVRVPERLRARPRLHASGHLPRVHDRVLLRAVLRSRDR